MLNKISEKIKKAKKQNIAPLPFDLNTLNQSPRPVLKDNFISYITYKDENGETYMAKPCGLPKKISRPYNSPKFDIDIIFETNQAPLSVESN